MIKKIILLLLFLVCISCRSQYEESIGDVMNIYNIPEYPNIINKTNVEENRSENLHVSQPIQTFDFHTNDSFDKVYQFYHERMSLLGWKTLIQNKSQLVFGNTEPCPLYWVFVYNETSSSDWTTVKIKIEPIECIKNIQ